MLKNIFLKEIIHSNTPFLPSIWSIRQKTLSLRRNIIYLHNHTQMKKLLLLPISVFLLVSFSMSLSSCSKEDRQNLFGSILEILLHNATASNDSISYMSGIWAYSSTDGKEIDTFWIYTDSTIMEHYISVDDTLDIQLSGGYLYYPSFKQMLVQWNNGYNFATKRPFEFSEQHIYNVKIIDLPSIPIGGYNSPEFHTLSLDDLDTETGDVLSSASYTYVGPVDQEEEKK